MATIKELVQQGAVPRVVSRSEAYSILRTLHLNATEFFSQFPRSTHHFDSLDIGEYHENTSRLHQA